MHNDISMKNLAFYRGEGEKPVAVLIDFDLATMPPLDDTKRVGRIGTVPFMCCAMLVNAECAYSLHYELESFFYCAVWHGLGYETSEEYPRADGSTDDILKNWRVGNFERMGMRKNLFLTSSMGLETLRYIADESYARKCKLLWRLFKTTILSEETDSDEEEATPEKYAHAPASKVSCPMLLDALGYSCHATNCREDCCSRRRRILVF